MRSSCNAAKRHKALSSPLWSTYALAVLATAGIAFLIMLLRFDVGGPPVILFLVAVIASAYWGGIGPGLTATGIAAVSAGYLLLEPHFQFTIARPVDQARWAALVIIGMIISASFEALHRSREKVETAERQSAVTLCSLSDAVVTTDQQGIVRFLNPAAERLTGWTIQEAAGAPLSTVLQLVHEETGVTADLVERVLRGEAIPSLRSQGTLIARDGRKTPVEGSATPIMQPDAAVAGVVLVFEDCIERRAAEEALRESERRHRRLFENMLSGLAYCRMLFQDGQPWDFVYFAVNPAFEVLTGLQNVIGKKASEVIPGIRESDPGLLEIYGRVARTGVPERFEIYLSALQQWFAVSAYCPQPGYFVAIFDVITERKHAEEALRASEAALRESERVVRTLMSNLPGMAYRCANDRDWTMEFVSDGCTGLTGYASSDLIGNNRISYGQIIHPEDRNPVWDHVQDFVWQNQPYELVYRIMTATGEEKWVWEQGQAVFSPEGDVLALEGFISEISSRKRAERLLREKLALQGQLSQSEQRLQALVSNIPDVTWTADSTGRILFISSNVERVLGYTLEEIYAANQEIWFSKIDPRDAERVQQAYKSLFTKGMQFDIEYRSRKKDGSWIWIHDRAMTVYENDGVSCADGIFADITSRKQAESLLQQQAALQQQLSRIVDATPGAIFSYRLRPDGSSCMPFTSPRIQELIGITPEDLSQDASSAFARVHKDDIGPLQESLRKSARDLSLLIHEFRVTNPEKGEVWVEGRGMPEEEPDGSVVWHGVLTDATDRKRLEQQFQQAQKMEAIGLLAGGVAHDFNNLLGVILGYSDMLLEELPPDDPKRKQLERIKKSSERGVSLTRQLLAFSRKSVQQPRVLDLNEVVGEAEDLIRRFIGEDIHLNLNLQASINRVRADPGQVEQILMNLAVNARDAMPQGGTLTIETRNIELDQDYAQNHVAAQPGPYALLAVSDTGVGMDKETQARLFEPFFTTKERGKGTGLGLATVYGIVKQSGGYIWVYSEPGQGATFKIYLPAAAEVLERQAEYDQPKQEGSTATGTVLVVEDAEEMRELACEFLKGNGYEVLRAADGLEALQVLERHGSRVHLLLTDVIMPGMSGSELAARVRTSCPDMQIIFMSGYTDDAIARHGVLEAGVDLIEKPFTRETLLRRVHLSLSKVRAR